MYGELAVARAIGSAAWKRDPSKRALIPTPDLVSIQLQPEDDFVVLATDGLWDKVDNTQVRGARGAVKGGRDRKEREGRELGGLLPQLWPPVGQAARFMPSSSRWIVCWCMLAHAVRSKLQHLLPNARHGWCVVSCGAEALAQ